MTLTIAKNKTEETELKVSIIESKPFSIPLKVESSEEIYETVIGLCELYEFGRKSRCASLKPHLKSTAKLIEKLTPQLSFHQMLELSERFPNHE